MARRPADRVDVRFLEVVVRSIVASRENARNIREKISGEMWEQLNRMYLLVREAEREKVWNEEPGAIVRAVIEGAHLFHGITDSTLSHDEGWHYIQIGRFIERAATTAALLEARFGAPAHEGTRACRATPRITPNGSRCCARARRSRPTCATTPPICGPSGSPNSCC